EGGRKSRTLLYAAIAALVVVAIVTFWFLNRRRGEAPPAAPTAGAVTPAPWAATPGGAPGTTPPASATPGVDIQALVDKKLAQEEEARKKLEAQKIKELEDKIAAAKAAGKPLSTTPAPAAATPAPAPRPSVPEP